MTQQKNTTSLVERVTTTKTRVVLTVANALVAVLMTVRFLDDHNPLTALYAAIWITVTCVWATIVRNDHKRAVAAREAEAMDQASDSHPHEPVS